MFLLKVILSYTEAGKAIDYISKVTLDLIKARRERGQAEKVDIEIILYTMPLN